MSLRKIPSRNLTWLAIAWLVVTVSLVTWWWIHAVQSSDHSERIQRMFLWEGVFLLAILSVGGAVLVYLTYEHHRRHERMKTFFSIFAHDLKTSMTRLRLQGELLEESAAGRDPKIKKLFKDIHLLDLQLENSLWMAQIDTSPILIQDIKLSEVMHQLRNEFDEMQIDLNRDAVLRVDKRAFGVVLRNLFHNSRLHGSADRIGISVETVAGSKVKISIVDNGSGLKIPVENLGREILSTSRDKSNGLGLYLSRRLIEKMDGRLHFSKDSGFSNVLELRGGVL